MINTIYGEMDETTLNKVEGSLDNINEYTTWVEYYNDKQELVHRSATVTIKRGFIGGILAGNLGG